MRPSDFREFFESATANTAYEYQVRLAEGPCESRLINIPTGLGKTAAVVLAWLYNRVHLKSENWPRRLAWYEAVLRVADQRASKLAEQNAPTLSSESTV